MSQKLQTYDVAVVTSDSEYAGIILHSLIAFGFQSVLVITQDFHLAADRISNSKVEDVFIDHELGYPVIPADLICQDIPSKCRLIGISQHSNQPYCEKHYNLFPFFPPEEVYRKLKGIFPTETFGY